MNSTDTKPLPTPDEIPAADVVIFDGKCRFCTGQVRNLQRWDGRNRLAYLSLHSPSVAQRFPELTHEQMMQQIYVIPAGPDLNHAGTPLGGAAALRYLTRRLPKLWVFAPFLHVPFSLPIWQFFYKQVAKRRYRIANKDGQPCDDDHSCEVHFKD